MKEQNKFDSLIIQEKYKNQILNILEKYKNQKVVFYGCGELFEALCRNYNFNDYFNVIGISDIKFEKETISDFMGYKTIKPKELNDCFADIIILTLAFPKKVLAILKKQRYSHIKEIFPIILKMDPLFKYDICCTKQDKEKVYYHLNEYNVDLVADEYYGIIEEVFFWQIYNIKNKFKFSNYTLYNVGMNRAYTDIYFAIDERCKKCFGFEPFKKTFQYAVENINLNPNIAEKIIPFNYGLSDENKKESVYFLPHRDGISSTNYDFIKNYAPEELNNLIEEEIELRKSSDVLKGLISTDPYTHKILKLDAEGAEYQVIPDLYRNNVLSKFNIIIGDMHILNSKKDTLRLFDYMYNAGFKVYELNEHDKTIDYILYKDIETI